MITRIVISGCNCTFVSQISAPVLGTVVLLRPASEKPKWDQYWGSRLFRVGANQACQVPGCQGTSISFLSPEAVALPSSQDGATTTSGSLLWGIATETGCYLLTSLCALVIEWRLFGLLRVRSWDVPCYDDLHMLNLRQTWI